MIAELERICDHLVLLHNGQVRLAGDIGALLAEHRLLVGPRTDETDVDGPVTATHGHRHSDLLVRQPAGVGRHPRWETTLSAS